MSGFGWRRSGNNGNIDPVCMIDGNIGSSKWFNLYDASMKPMDEQPWPIKYDGKIDYFVTTTGSFSPPTIYDIEIYINDFVTPVTSVSVTEAQQCPDADVPVAAGDLVAFKAVQIVSPGASDMVIVAKIE